MRFEQIQILITCLVFFIAFFLNFPKIKGEEKNEPHKLKHRVYFFDFIKTLSIISVIYIHIIGFFDSSITKGATNYALIYLVKIVRFCVPFFIISSGYTLSIESLSKKDILGFYKKRFLNLYIPYIIFFVISFLISSIYIASPYLSNPIFTLLFGTDHGALTVFYFIHILFGLYLLYPLFVFLFNKIKNTKLFLFILLIFSLIASFYFPTLFNNYIYTLFPHIFYFALGIFIRKYEDNKKVSNFIKRLTPYCIITIILFLVLLFFEERDTIYSNFNIAYASALFILLYNIKDKIKKNKFFEIIGQNSLFIFIFHFVCLQFIFKYLPLRFYNTNHFLIITIILEFTISLGVLPFISIGIKKIISKIKPKLNK